MSTLNESFSWPTELDDARLHLREWLMEGGDPNQLLPSGCPLWAEIMRAGHPEAIEELLQIPFDPNLRDINGNGWLHWGLQCGLEPDLVLEGALRLDQTWWHPNHEGITPFHMVPIASIVRAYMGARWLGTRRPWSDLCERQDPVETAREAGMLRQARDWEYWRGLSRA